MDSSIMWETFVTDENKVELEKTKTPRLHQVEAITAVIEGLKDNNRGKLIMAPGTGKTYTSLQIAEKMAQDKDGMFKVLYLVPSIQLLSQSLRGWTSDTIYTNNMETIAVC